MLTTYLLRLRERSKDRQPPKRLLMMGEAHLGNAVTKYWKEVSRPEKEIHYRMLLFLYFLGVSGRDRMLLTATQRNGYQRTSERAGYVELYTALTKEMESKNFLYIGHSNRGIPRENASETALFANVEELYWWAFSWSLTHKDLPIMTPKLKHDEFIAWIDSEVSGKIGELPYVKKYLDHWSSGVFEPTEVIKHVESVPGMVESIGLNPRSSMESMATWTEDKFWDELTALYLYSVNELKIGAVREILALKAKAMGLLKETPSVVNNNLYVTEKALTKLRGMGLAEVEEQS